MRLNRLPVFSREDQKPICLSYMKPLQHYQAKLSRRLFECAKAIWFAMHTKSKATSLVLIMGNGRSGTTMLGETFARDFRIESLHENDPKVQQDFMLVYERLPYVVALSRAHTLVIKPILNSFDAAWILKEYPEAKIIWLVRDYLDVASSTVEKWGPRIGNWLRDLVLHNTGDNWLSRGIPDDTLAVLRTLDVAELSDHDLICLVWWSVNRTVLLHRLQQGDRLLGVRYEALAQNPRRVLGEIYEWMGLEFRPYLAKYVHARSVGKGAHVRIQPLVQRMCDDLSRELASVFGWPLEVPPERSAASSNYK